MAKVVTKEEFKEIKKSLGDKKIGLCHGVFDLVHPGHIIHFEEAKSACDILVVSITAAQYVRKGPDRPYFDDDMRLRFLSEISCIDYVMLSEAYTVDDIIECVEPDLYIKGEEYKKASDDVTGMIDHEANLVKQHGGQMYYTSGAVFSSTKLINKGMGGLSPEVIEFAQNFTGKYSLDDVRKYSSEVEKLKVLVVGDIIIDKYTYCVVQGLMSKDTAYSTRYVDEEEQLGGSLAIARHMAQFCPNITLCSVMGNEEHYKDMFSSQLGDMMCLELIESELFPTIVKQRFIQKNPKREEYKKMFTINNIPVPTRLDDTSEKMFYNKLNELLPQFDLVVVCDFGHGLINQRTMDLIQDRAKVIALNCQTNSTNHGKNIITKYHRADYFALDQREINLAYPSYDINDEDALKMLGEYIHGCGWLTMGSAGAMAVDKDGRISLCPAFTLKVVDTIGAGDAFYSVASLYSTAGAPVDLALFMGNVAGSLASNIVGNRAPVEKSNLLKFASTLLNV